ncbi:glycosyltransferase [Anabaenopsis sp. FSS-46]|uniref:glycosyltransferase family 4 protein n=1 Tax=Anabaenopsis sp. FSS-46 TaxID=2971766 RepID=UPI0024737A26|nr:glycosyltransferase [Anabaenopsis sp. FSS-46]MDH6099007.1 glycosyltransferase [Anabaenopsis sp. FSS-46]
MKILHIIDFLCLGGAARSMIAISKYSQQLDQQVQHQVISLKPAQPEAVELAKLGGMEFIDPVDEIARYELIAEADIVHIHYWNNPQMFAFVHSELPPSRLIIWFHVSGDNAPQVITRDLINYADFAIPCNPHSYDLPVVGQLAAGMRQKKVGMVYDAADFERVKNIQPQPHDTFNVGYMGALSFSKMHPSYIAMSAKADIPNVKFILCGGGNVPLLQQQALELNSLGKFDFRGFVEDIAGAIGEFDIYGYPVCEDTYAAAELNLQEVMYAGVPPVVFPYGGIKKLVIDNYTGLVVKSELEYSQALEYLYHHPQERLRLGKNAQEYARQIFGAENAAKQLNPIYHRLMLQEKRSRQWGIPVDGSLLDEPVSVLDVVDIPPRFAGAKTFIESLGETAPQFFTSLTGEDIQELFAADEKIAGSSTLLGLGEGGVVQYAMFYPDDGYLQLWSGLVWDSEGKTQNALVCFAKAINLGCNHWRVFWYLAQVAERLEKVAVLKEALDHLSRVVPSFTPLEEMGRRLEKLVSSQSDISSLKLRDINLIIFPDPEQSEQCIYEELVRVITSLENHPDCGKMTLLVNAGKFPPHLTQAFTEQLCEEEEEGLQISVVGKLSRMQWEALLPRLTGRIVLAQEDGESVGQLPMDGVPLVTVDC